MMFDPEQLTLLIHWITERERVRQRKEQGLPRPWTTDPIIHEWRFCNVNRCHDRETVWIFDNIIGKHDSSPVLWFNLAIARFINWSPSLATIGYFDEWDAARFVRAVNGVKGKAYTGAYMIPAGPPGKGKAQFLADDVFTPIWKERYRAPIDWYTCDVWDRFFEPFRCMGDFMRNQIITDMKYSHHLPRGSTADWMTFVLAGPGTQRGLNRLHGIDLNHKWKQETARQALTLLRNTLNQKAGETIAHFDDLNNLSNCMCEFDKFCRVRNNEGKPRSRYVPA